MIYNAKNETVQIDNTEMDYITFGYGKKNVILIPGLGDGLRTVKGTALPFSSNQYAKFLPKVIALSIYF